VKRASSRGRILGWLLLIGFLLAPLLVLRSRWAWDEACTQARRRLPAILGMEVGIGRCELDPIRQSVRLFGVSAFEPGRQEPLLSADSAELRLDAIAPVFGPVELSLVQVIRPRINLDLSRPRPSGGSRACPLDALDRVELDRLLVHDAELRVRLPAGRRLELSAVDLSWAMRRGEAEIDLKAQSGALHLGEGKPAMSVGSISFEGTLDPEAEQLQIAEADLALDDLTLNLSGRVDTLCDPTLALDAQVFAPLRTVGKVVALPERTQGHLWARVLATGKAAAPSISGEVVGAGVVVGRFDPGSFSARLALDGRELKVIDFSAPAGPGAVRASGSVGLHGAFPVRAQVSLDRAELGKILDRVAMPGAWVDLLASGKVTLAGTGAPLALAGEGDLALEDFRITSHPYDAVLPVPPRPVLEFARGRAQAQIQVLQDRVELAGLEVSTGRSRLVGQATLHYPKEAGLSVELRAEPLDLADFGHVGKLAWAGAGTASFAVKGPYRDIRVEGQVSMRDLEIWDVRPGVVQGEIRYERRALKFPSLTGQKGQTQYFGWAELDWSRERGGAVQAQIQVPDGRAEDLVDIILPLHSSVELFQGDLLGEASGQMTFQGPLDRFDGAIDLELEKLTYYGRRLGSGAVSLRFRDGEAMDLTRATLDGPSGRLFAEGEFHFAGPIRYSFRGEDLQLGELLGAERARQLGVSGTLQLQEGRVSGDRVVPLVEASLTSPRVAFAEKSLGAMKLKISILGRKMEVVGPPFADASASLKMTLRDPLPYELNLKLSLPEIRPLLPDGAISQGLSGSLSGVLQAVGAVRRPATTVASAVVDRISLTRGDFTGTNQGPISLRFERGRYSLDSFSLVGPNTRLAVHEGWAGPDAVEAKVQGTVDVRLLASFVPGLERAGGTVDLDASATGPLAGPKLLGSVRIRDARLTLRDQPVTVRSLSGSIQFSERQIRIEHLDGVVNDGRVDLAGYVDLDRFGLRRGCARPDAARGVRRADCLSLTTTLDEVSIRPREDLSMTASGSLTLAGEPDAMRLEGNVSVSRFKYDRPLDLETFLKDVARTRERFAVATSSSAERPREWLRFDHVAVDLEDVRVENNLARAKLIGRVSLTGTNARPGLLGTVEAAEGSQAFFRNNRFELEQFLLEFKERYSFDAIFDMHARAQIREYLVRLHAFGKPNEPKVILTSEPALESSDLLSLLTLGVTSRDQSRSAGAEYLVAEALFNATGLDRQVQRFLPRTELLQDLSFHVSTTYNDALHQMEPAAQIESRLLTEDLKLQLTRPFSGRGTRARAEYRFKPGLLLQGQWDNENTSAQDVGNFGVDLKLRWEVK
jgi:translocation and assembly module TamB